MWTLQDKLKLRVGRGDCSRYITRRPVPRRQRPPFKGHTKSHTHSSCREGRWENIRSLISKKVPLTRLLQGKRGAEGCPGCFQEMPTQVCSWPHPPPELHPIPPWDEATCV